MSIKSKQKFYFADLFAGVGGMRLAFEKAGGECILTSEIDEMAIKTYELNFPPSSNHVLVNDVLDLKARDFLVKGNDLTALVAGFPCQPYSIAGLRKGLQDDRGGEIFIALLRLLKSVKPKSFLLENVKGIVSHDGGATFRYMVSAIEKQGYFVRFQTLNSKVHSNIPQNRERVFIIGFKDPGAAERFEFPPAVELTRTIHDCLESGKVGPAYYYDGRFKISPQINESVTAKDTLYQWRRHYVRENKSNSCPTLTANMGSGGHNVPLVRDSWGVRKLTPRETANFQGFPKSFKLPEIANSHLYHQFGNSVTVPLIEKIAKNIVKALDVG
jgi:DNA (cytosine-5)-methyltransferase 1